MIQASHSNRLLGSVGPRSTTTALLDEDPRQAEGKIETGDPRSRFFERGLELPEICDAVDAFDLQHICGEPPPRTSDRLLPPWRTRKIEALDGRLLCHSRLCPDYGARSFSLHMDKEELSRGSIFEIDVADFHSSKLRSPMFPNLSSAKRSS